MLKLPAVCSLLVLCAFISAVPLAAQQAAPNQSSPPSSSQIFRPPMADPFEPASRVRYGGDSLDFGLALPLAVYTSEGPASAWQVGFIGGIAARFGSERTTLYLKSANFHAGIPISLRKGKWSARAEFYHVSSHLGADYSSLTGAQPFHYSREAIQGLIAYDAPHGLRFYGGPTLLVRTYPHVGRWTLQAGTEWFPRSLSGKRWEFYLADDFQTRGEVAWRTNISVEPGIEFRTRKGEPVARIEAWFYSGQVPFGELYRTREQVVGAQFIFTLEPAIKSLITRRHY
ncbi:MAG: DUF1207 domain-containing protein [Acidobacteriota bacterium]|nr:DUF1207 domain-containing protein [Acidobacteriota bacterium]